MGTLIMIVGPMYAGKTTKLIELAADYIANGRTVTLYKPDMDKRYHDTKIVTHDGVAVDAEVLNTTTPFIASNSSVVFIDELHFFDPRIVEIVHNLLHEGIDVVISGVNKDFRGEPIRNVRELMPHADEIHLLHAKCAQCGQKAPMSQRLINGQPARYNDPIIMVGSIDVYEPRCKHCHKVIREV